MTNSANMRAIRKLMESAKGRRGLPASTWMGHSWRPGRQAVEGMERAAQLVATNKGVWLQNAGQKATEKMGEVELSKGTKMVVGEMNMGG